MEMSWELIDPGTVAHIEMQVLSAMQSLGLSRRKPLKRLARLTGPAVNMMGWRSFSPTFNERFTCFSAFG